MNGGRPTTRARSVLIAGLAALLGCHGGAVSAAFAQDFDTAAAAGPVAGGAVLLERALPAPAKGSGLEMLAVRWSALADFSTRALALSAESGALRFAAGLSSSGDGEIGWNSAALAMGFATPAGGVGTRVIGRRDRSSREPAQPRAIGIEVGAGFWSAFSSRAEIWVSLPTLYHAGEAPPLDRGLESGLRVRSGQLSGWLAWTAPARAADAGERIAGAGFETGALEAWIEARDRPVRAALGLRVRRGSLEIAASASEHPVLGETVRLALIARHRAHVPTPREGPG